MPKDYTGKRIDKILKPGDPGFNDPSTPWGGIRNVTGWQKPDAVKLHIAGFFLMDKRMSPPIAIFKNMTIVGNTPPKFGSEPVPFNSLDEALHHKDKMHLSSTDEPKVRPTALCPDPGLGNPKPNIMWVDRKAAKSM